MPKKMAGQISLDAVEYAADLIAVTRWQKYIVYQVVMGTAIRFHPLVDPNDLFPFEPKQQDQITNPSIPWAVADENEFRRIYKVKSNADLFRKSMNVGATLFRLLEEGDVDRYVPRAELLSHVGQHLGDGESFRQGLDLLKSWAERAD